MSSFCACGLQKGRTILNLDLRLDKAVSPFFHLCEKHLGKPLPKVRTKQPRYSGPSQHQAQLKGFQQSGHS